MTDDGLKGQTRVTLQQRQSDQSQSSILRAGIGSVVGTLEFDANRKVIAPGTVTPL
jgi:hypothetical protein